MKIDPKQKTITCNCNLTGQIQNAPLFRAHDSHPYLFICDRCQSEITIPIGFNDLIGKEVLKTVNSSVQGSNNQFDDFSDDFKDVWLGENQVPITDELIEELVKKGMNREELVYMQKEGARYSTTRKSFLFPPEGGLAE